MARAFRRVWEDDKELAELGNRTVHGLAPTGDLIEGWVWGTSWRTCRALQQRLSDSIDLSPSAELVTIWRLWLAIVNDRLSYGDRL